MGGGLVTQETKGRFPAAGRDRIVERTAEHVPAGARESTDTLPGMVRR